MILSNPVHLLIAFFASYIILKLLLAFLLRELKINDKSSYKKWGEPDVDFMNMSMLENVWWNSISGKFNRNIKLTTLQLLIIVLSIIFILSLLSNITFYLNVNYIK